MKDGPYSSPPAIDRCGSVLRHVITFICTEPVGHADDHQQVGNPEGWDGWERRWPAETPTTAMIDLEAIRARNEQRDKCHDYTGCEKNHDLVFICTEHFMPSAMQDDIDALIAEVERLQTALSRDVPHGPAPCDCGHFAAAHRSVLLCMGCVAK